MYTTKKLLSADIVGKRVCVIGANGGIGQPLSMLLKLNDNISHINLFDIVGASGIATDLSHINSNPIVKGYGLNFKQFNEMIKLQKKNVSENDNNLLNYQNLEINKALKGNDIVVITAGLPRKPGMTRQDLFHVNASLMYNFADKISENCPNALVAIISNPVNSLVPVFAERMKQNNTYNPSKLFGVTTLDILRANTFISEITGVKSSDINIPVIGGHAGESILPLFSQSKPYIKHMLNDEQVDKITKRVQNAGTEVVLSKDGNGSATLSMARAGSNFVNSLIKGLNGEDNIVECAYVESNIVPDCKWFSTPVKLGKNGIEKNYGIGQLDAFEKDKLKKAIEELKPSINEGVNYVIDKSKVIK